MYRFFVLKFKRYILFILNKILCICAHLYMIQLWSIFNFMCQSWILFTWEKRCLYKSKHLDSLLILNKIIHPPVPEKHFNKLQVKRPIVTFKLRPKAQGVEVVVASSSHLKSSRFYLCDTRYMHQYSPYIPPSPP